MAIKPDHNMSIKDYMSGLDKQLNKTKTTEYTKSNNKQSTSMKITTMNKEGGTSVKTKTPKPNKSDKSITDDPTGNLSQKRDASTRSPLEGNPGKKPRDNGKPISNNAHDYADDTAINEDLTCLSSTNMEMAHKNDGNDDKQDTKEVECQETTDSLLKELREIKNNILCLNERVKLNHQELSSKMADSIEIKEILVSQSEKDRPIEQRKYRVKILKQQT